MRKLRSFFKSIGIVTKFILLLGLLCIFFGIFLILYSFKYEIIDDKYLVIDYSESLVKSEPKLDAGEVVVTGETKYIRDGVFRVTFINYAEKIGKSSILKEDTDLTITDNLGEGYELYDKGIVINGKVYNTLTSVLSSEKIRFEYKDNSVMIVIPNVLINTNNNISFYIKLKDRNLNIKYDTTLDSYYSFEPSDENDFYEKKGYQSYVVNGEGYIKLAKK